jgi:hypothetical protein
VRRLGFGCIGCGCLGPLITLVILCGTIGIVAGNWAGIAHPDIVAASAEVADIPADYLVLYEQAEPFGRIDQIARIDAFRPSVFSFYPPSFIELLRRDLSQSGGASESRI